MVPKDQTIYQGQNAFFNCLLNDTDGRFVPVQWKVAMIDAPSSNVTMNTTDYLLLSPVNSTLVIVRPMRDLTITCRGGTRDYFAGLRVQCTYVKIIVILQFTDSFNSTTKEL